MNNTKQVTVCSPCESLFFGVSLLTNQNQSYQQVYNNSMLFSTNSIGVLLRHACRMEQRTEIGKKEPQPLSKWVQDIW